MNEPTFAYSGGRHADAQPGAPAVSARNLTIHYPGAKTPAVHDVSIRAESPSRVALVGANGSGKSTFLKALAGLLKPTHGRIEIYGNSVGACHHRVAYLPQRGEIDWNFPISLSQFVLSGRYVHLGWFRNPGPKDRVLAEGVLDRLHLKNQAETPIGQLSGGQQQRALLARALVQESDLLLLDEPLNAIDPETRSVLYSLMKNLCDSGKTLVVATHDIGSLAEMFDAVVFLDQGRTKSFPGVPLP